MLAMAYSSAHKVSIGPCGLSANLAIWVVRFASVMLLLLLVLAPVDASPANIIATRMREMCSSLLLIYIIIIIILYVCGGSGYHGRM